MNYPPILVCVPTVERYQAGKRIDDLPRAVRSIAAQTYPNVVIAVKLGRDDFTGYRTRNRIISEYPECRLIAYCDDDCWWEPNHLCTLYRKLVNGATAAFSRSVIHLHSGHKLFTRRARKPHFTKFDLNELLHTRDLLSQWPIDYNADWQVMNQWLRAGKQIEATGQPTVHYTLKPGIYPVAKFIYSQIKHA